MSNPPASLPQELFAAGQGTVRILAAQRDAGDYFSLDPRGLMGSFIALLGAIVLNIVLAMAIVEDGASVGSFSTLIGNVGLYAVQILATWLVLRGVGKGDYFVAYLTVDNWVTFFLSIALALAGLAGMGGETGLILAGLVTLWAKINIARIIVGLRALHIALLIIAQTFGGFVGLMFVSGLVLT